MQPDRGPVVAARLRQFVFVACLACTLWLVVQNSILLVLLPGVLASRGASPASPRNAPTEVRHD